MTRSYTGMLDYGDIVDFVLLVSRRRQLEPILEETDSSNVSPLQKIVHSALTGEHVSAKAVSDLSRKNPFYSVMEESPLEAALELLSSDSGVHRLNVVNADGKVVGIISQTDFLRFVNDRKELFKRLLEKKVNVSFLDW